MSVPLSERYSRVASWLSRHGWREGDGLGKAGTGSAEFTRVSGARRRGKNRSNAEEKQPASVDATAGLGAERIRDELEHTDWFDGAFERAAQRVKEKQEGQKANIRDTGRQSSTTNRHGDITDSCLASSSTSWTRAFVSAGTMRSTEDELVAVQQEHRSGSLKNTRTKEVGKKHTRRKRKSSSSFSASSASSSPGSSSSSSSTSTSSSSAESDSSQTSDPSSSSEWESSQDGTDAHVVPLDNKKKAAGMISGRTFGQGHSNPQSGKMARLARMEAEALAELEGMGSQPKRARVH